MAVIHVEIPDHLKESLQIFCAKKHKSQKEVITYAIQTLITNSRAEPLTDTIKKKEWEL